MSTSMTIPSRSHRGPLEDLYRELHSHPALSTEEHRTAAKAAKQLEMAGFEVTVGIGGNGVVGVLRNGDGPTVDGLPMKEATGLPDSFQLRVDALPAEPRRPFGSEDCPLGLSRGGCEGGPRERHSPNWPSRQRHQPQET